MHERLAIQLTGVTKIYKLHGNHRDRLVDVLGLQRLGMRFREPVKEHIALNDISLDVPRGHRIGIVGRNGAGKTTLLKLICGNFSPTQGNVVVNGSVQALMNVGLGFHPEYTGRENVEASLLYSGLRKDEYDAAMESIIEFCELGEYIDQPFRTYSLGMQARLMFASATAIHPDILIVDEVLGAGDAYFVAKSKKRVEEMIKAGCTMLLVSHSMQQVLELCNEAIWIDRGRIRMRGEAPLVVKAYEEYLYGPIREIPMAEANVRPFEENEASVAGSGEILTATPRTGEQNDDLLLQEPRFLPHGENPAIPQVSPPVELRFTSPEGISRWASDPGLKVCGFTIATEAGESNRLVSMRPAKFIINIVAEFDGDFECRYGLVFSNHMGETVAKLVSPVDVFPLQAGRTRCVEVLLNPNQLGAGEYLVSVSIHKKGPLEMFGATPRYDLVSRSFVVSVSFPESIAALGAAFMHSAEWVWRDSGHPDFK
jgi:lipopolysaccharide transport system ATP-binding protein